MQLHVASMLLIIPAILTAPVPSPQLGVDLNGIFRDIANSEILRGSIGEGIQLGRRAR